MQAFRSYLINNHLKYIVVKGESNEASLSKDDLVRLIKAASSFLTAQHGPNPKLQDRKSLAELIQKQFSQDPRMILRKLTQRMKNLNRLPMEKKYSSRAKERISAISSSDKNEYCGLQIDSVDVEGRSNDYEELLPAFKIK